MTHDTSPSPDPSAPHLPPLVIAADATPDAEGVATCRALADRVRGLLRGPRVVAGFVELTAPTIDDALAGVLSDGAQSAVVVPLTIDTGGHVLDEIREAIGASRSHHPAARVIGTRHLGSPRPLVAAARQRIDSARADWPAGEVTVIFVGRGSTVTDANADHVRLGRVLSETGGYRTLLPAFIQVTEPTVADALNVAYVTGSRRIVLMPHDLFRGRLATWVRRTVEDWQQSHPDAELRIAGVIGDCPELAEVVAKRYREGTLKARTDLGSPAYLTGLLLAGRKVVAVGGGGVNRRRVPKLLAAGAEVTVVSPELHPALAELAGQGRVAWQARGFLESDLDGAWYVLASTDSPQLNAAVAAAAEARHTFCVRADRADLGSAWTPATGEVEGATIAVIGTHNPRGSRVSRDRLLALLANADDERQ